MNLLFTITFLLKEKCAAYDVFSMNIFILQNLKSVVCFDVENGIIFQVSTYCSVISETNFTLHRVAHKVSCFTMYVCNVSFLSIGHAFHRTHIYQHTCISFC